MAGFFDKYEGSYGKSTGHYYIIGRVKRIVLGANLKSGQPNPDYNHEKDLGAVYFETLYSNKSGVKGTSSTSRPAYPIHSFVRQYPTIGEIVLIFPGPSSDLNDGTDRQDLWYMPPFGIWNSPNSNVFPNMEEYAKQPKRSELPTSDPNWWADTEKVSRVDDSWYNWNNRNWGTKWDVAVSNDEKYPDTELVDEEPNGDNLVLLYKFQTAWSPAFPVMEKLSAQYPDLLLTLNYQEETGWGGEAEFLRGEMISDADYNWECSECGYQETGEPPFCEECEYDTCPSCGYNEADERCEKHKEDWER